MTKHENTAPRGFCRYCMLLSVPTANLLPHGWIYWWGLLCHDGLNVVSQDFLHHKPGILRENQTFATCGTSTLQIYDWLNQKSQCGFIPGFCLAAFLFVTFCVIWSECTHDACLKTDSSMFHFHVSWILNASGEERGHARRLNGCPRLNGGLNGFLIVFSETIN